ncbi:MAG: hypothetical protein KF768_01630 [Phycisphaeraceae bacterium]|nr:hypothetical protein [Phycisphaeraceae bacterium]
MRDSLVLLITIAATLTALLAACAGSANGPDRAPEPATPDDSFWVGHLQGGIMHIGGEGTGWVLRTDAPVDGQPGVIDVDVSRVMDQARAFADRRVRIEGRLFEKRYVERGPVMVLAATAIRAVD